MRRMFKCKAGRGWEEVVSSNAQILEDTKFVKEIVNSPTSHTPEQGANMRSSAIWNKLEGVKGY